MQEILRIAGQMPECGSVKSAMVLASRATGLSVRRIASLWYLEADAWAHEADHLREWLRLHNEKQARRLDAQTDLIATRERHRTRHDDLPASEMPTVDRRQSRDGQAYAGADRRKAQP